MNHPVVGIVVLLLVSGALGAAGWFFVREFKNRYKDDDE